MPWLFAILLACVQQFALLHPYEHLTDWKKSSTNQPVNQKDKLPHSGNCTQCMAIAGVDSAVALKVLVLHTSSASVLCDVFVLPSIAITHFLAYRTRAPPSHI
ncbi:MAG TPA: hypothetical protein DCO68_01580 [Methylophilaceae bacterium]|nr:hypothetical protein [Methylophilaceae bacterium]HAJ70751.1 hypothetical protein [Methylophilaceae bacterium]